MKNEQEELYDPAMRRELEKRLFHSLENRNWHNSYDQELRELSAIEQGDLELLKKSLQEYPAGRLGIMCEHDPLRNEQINAIVVITTASRAALRGGLPNDVSFTLSDICFNLVEAVNQPGEAMKIARSAEFLYATLVRELLDTGGRNLNTGNEHIDSCKDYIFRHLHGRITVGEIAGALNLNPDYLSALFRKSEGITISRYILQRKIALTKNLLIYSNYTYSEIAHYLGFSSQSHLGSCFRKETGTTLKQYRYLYQMKDFF